MKKKSDESVMYPYEITRNEMGDLFYLLSRARLKLTDKDKTMAYNYWKKVEKILGLSTE